MKRFFAAAAALLLLGPAAFGWGPEGHRIVGAIADKRLAGTETGKKVALLLDGYTLEKAALIPDEIKGWDKDTPDKPGIFHYSSRPKLDQQLTAFWHANPPTDDRNSPVPSHHWFHYTDVPLVSGGKYADGKAGRSQWDVVQMIKYCARVLRGEEPEENARKITKPIAVILLAHFVGDIHQPLHVGAEFYDANGNAVDPDKVSESFENQGANTIILHLNDKPGVEPPRTRPKMHSFWDYDSVVALMPPVPREMDKEQRRPIVDAGIAQLVETLAQEEPKNWQAPKGTDPTEYSEQWANEVLPLAAEAHSRLRFGRIAPKEYKTQTLAAGPAFEKEMPDGIGYQDWASRAARERVHLAGWRLANLLEETLGDQKATSRRSAAARLTSSPALMIIPTAALAAGAFFWWKRRRS